MSKTLVFDSVCIKDQNSITTARRWRRARWSFPVRLTLYIPNHEHKLRKFFCNYSFSSFVGFHVNSERVKPIACCYHPRPHKHYTHTLLQLSGEMWCDIMAFAPKRTTHTALSPIGLERWSTAWHIIIFIYPSSPLLPPLLSHLQAAAVDG